MATPAQCTVAIGALAAKLAGPGDARAGNLDRSVSAEVTDLGVTFRGHLHDGLLDDITSGVSTDAGNADIRLILSSEDLVALASGDLPLGSAWLSGRVKIRASLTDMLRLRSMI